MKLLEEGGEPAAGPDIAMTPSRADRRSPTGPHVLIVEDDPGARRSLLLLLRGLGFDAVAYSAVAQALADAAARPPACLIVDDRLSDGDGVGLLAALRQGGWRGPAILIAATAHPELARAAAAAGFAMTFDKPLRERALVDSVRRLIART